MLEYRKQWLDNTRGCPPPEELFLPIGSGVRTKESGFEIGGALWIPQIGLVVPDNVQRVKNASAHMDGFEIRTGATYSGTPRVDSLYPGGDAQTRFYGTGMIEIYCVVTDFRKALTSMKTNPVLTCCPVCVDTTRYLDDTQYRDLYDACSRYFLRYWYYGTIAR
jgi:hypothetical protein